VVEKDTATQTGEVASRYIAAWNEPDADARRRAVADLWTEDGAYTDPLAAVEGHEAIEAVISGAHEMFPGHVFKLLGDIDAHHDVARFGWELVPEGGGESVVIGFDVAVIAGDGRLRNVYGFLDKVPTS
jgi:ketosteroid isomerase-like protein